jgi:CRP-like cAMP-binding protein
MESTRSVLSRIPLLVGLPEPDLARIAACAEPRSLAAGQYAARQGEESDVFLAVIEGRLALTLKAPNGERHTVQAIGKGEVAGWSWLFPPHRWHFDVVATLPTEVLVFDGRQLRVDCESDHSFGYRLTHRFAQLLAQRLLAASLQL